MYGTIVNTYDFNNVKTIKFRQNRGKAIEYGPDQIAAFGLENGRFFISRKLPNQEGLTFFQVILSGKLSLLKQKSTFYIENDYEIVPLINSDQNPVGGKDPYHRYNKRPYTGTLNLLLAGECGNHLIFPVMQSSYNETSLLSILAKYHECEGLEYKIHVTEMPLMRLSPVVTGGIALIGQNYYPVNPNHILLFDRNAFPMFQAGFKLHQFRKAPRLAFDLAVGYINKDNTLNFQLSDPEGLTTGTQTYRSSSLLVPIFVDYALFKVGSIGTYFGVGGVIRNTKFESDFAIVDHTLFANSITTVTEEQFFFNEDKGFAPAIKLGAHINQGGKVGLLSEIQLDYQSNTREINFPATTTIYKQFTWSFLFSVIF